MLKKIVIRYNYNYNNMDITFPTAKISSFPLKAERSSPSIFKPFIMSTEGRPFKDDRSGYVKSVNNTVRN